MPGRLRLTLACDDCGIARPLEEGAVTLDGIELTVLTAMDSAMRHWCFLRRGEFDMVEVSAFSCVAARDRGMPFRAIPVFPHRRFRHGFALVNTASGIRGPRNLAGRRVGAKSFMTIAVPWLRGVLQHEHGVPPQSVEWVKELDEDVAFTPLPGAAGVAAGGRAVAGADAAVGQAGYGAQPRPDPAVAGPRSPCGAAVPRSRGGGDRPLPPTGVFPVMHVVGLRAGLMERHPWVSVNLYGAFEQAKALAMCRMREPRVVPLAWCHVACERQKALLGPGPWEYGLTDRNRHPMETLAGYFPRARAYRASGIA